MQPFFRNNLFIRGLLALWLVVALFSTAALGWQSPASAPATTATTAVASTATLTAAEREAEALVKLETIRELTTKLSSKEFEGRGTGQPGADKAANYLAEHFAKLKLKPGGDNGSYLQPIKFRSTQVSRESTAKSGEIDFKHGEDFVILPPYTFDQLDLSAGVVFAGYGVVSQDLNRDDLAGLDLKDKIVIVVNGQPSGVDNAAWRRATSPQARTMSLLSRGTAALIIANAGTPNQPFSTVANYLSRRQVRLGGGPDVTFKIPPVLLASNDALEKLFTGSESTYAETLEKAKTGEMVSRDLGKTLDLNLRVKREEVTSSNVIAVLEGTDEKLKEEAVVYTAHYDAYGIDDSGRIFPGAADNALGTAIISAIAEAFAKSKVKPRRSIVFLAVTGEEYGLLGAEYWIQNPTWPIEKVAANINFDGIGTEVYGPVKRVVGFGAEHSDLGSVFEEVSVAKGITVTPDPMPEENAFVRSDHYAFVKKGVPALMIMGGPAGEVDQWIARMKKWIETDYHAPSDTIKPDWNWSGPQTVAQAGLIIGLRVANNDAMPKWNTTSPYNKPRVQAKPAAAS